MDMNGRPPLASVVKRFAAILLDGLLASLILLPLGITGYMLSLSLPTMPGEGMMTFVIFLTLLTYLGLISYSALVMAMWAYGLTPGKKLLGMQVVRVDTGVPVGFWRMALRQVIGQWVSAVICYLGFIWALFDANRQGWHDKIAKTLVVQTR